MDDVAQIGSIELPNRFFRSATNEYLADDDTAAPTEAMCEMYLALAEGGVGLIVTGQAYVERVGRNMRFSNGIDSDGLISE